MVADVDGVVIIDQDQAQQVYETALARRDREQVLMEQLLKGKTTLELLGLAKVKEGTVRGRG